MSDLLLSSLLNVGSTGTVNSGQPDLSIRLIVMLSKTPEIILYRRKENVSSSRMVA
jgi:hypothetical protein